MEINFLAMGQTQKYAGVKPVNRIPTLLVLIEAQFVPNGIPTIWQNTLLLKQTKTHRYCLEIK